MRLGRSNKRPLDNQCHVFQRFLWLPLTIDGETRWLEITKIEMKYHRAGAGDYWEIIRFVNP
jgi:hypothetical protein